MKSSISATITTVVSLLILGLSSGCATSIKGDSEPSIMTANGPNILNARAEPEVVVLNRDLQPTIAGEMMADVKDFKYPVSSVEVKFQALPLNIEMEHVAGSTWRVEFTPQQLQMLAVLGKTVSYKADIMATNSRGETSTSSDPVNISVAAPETSALDISAR